MKAFGLFESLRKGILLQFEAAGIYCESLFAIINDRPIDQNHFRKLINEPVISGLSMFEQFYKDSDFEYLEKNEKMKYFGQQILLSVYTVLEIYFIEKFKEYMSYRLSNLDSSLQSNIIDKIVRSLRSIDDIKESYYKYLDIHLPSFDIKEIFTQPRCSFKPPDAWNAIIILSKARNEIAHSGIAQSYKVTTLLDCWYPFEFINYYIPLFDANFDSLLYKNRKNRLIVEYEKRKFACTKQVP